MASVSCDFCQMGCDAAGHDRTEARFVAKQLGWVYVNRKDICPACQAGESGRGA